MQYRQPRRIAVYDAQTLNFVASGELQPDATGAWCAINPLTGLLYESPFYELDTPSSTVVLSVYKPALKSTELILEFLGNFELRDKDGRAIVLKRIQGGVFSKNGHLYLVSDSEDDKAAIYGFDMISGRNTVHIKVSYDPG